MQDSALLLLRWLDVYWPYTFELYAIATGLPGAGFGGVGGESILFTYAFALPHFDESSSS